MFSVMLAALISQTAEDVYGSPRPGARVSSRDVLAMATIEGARAAGLGHAVGSITPGKQADFVLVDLTHVNLVGAPDPVGVIVASGHAGNIDTVVLAGRVVKRRGALLDDDLVSRVSRLAIASRERLEREVAARMTAPASDLAWAGSRSRSAAPYAMRPDLVRAGWPP